MASAWRFAKQAGPVIGPNSAKSGGFWRPGVATIRPLRVAVSAIKPSVQLIWRAKDFSEEGLILNFWTCEKCGYSRRISEDYL